MNIAIIGSGPSAFYTVQSFLRENPSTNIDVLKTSCTIWTSKIWSAQIIKKLKYN